MGPTLNNLDKLLRLPFGCGEQNMIHFAPNVFVLKYLQKTRQLSTDVETEATDYLLQGKQTAVTLYCTSWHLDFCLSWKMWDLLRSIETLKSTCREDVHTHYCEQRLGVFGFSPPQCCEDFCFNLGFLHLVSFHCKIHCKMHETWTHIQWQRDISFLYWRDRNEPNHFVIT